MPVKRLATTIFRVRVLWQTHFIVAQAMCTNAAPIAQVYIRASLYGMSQHSPRHNCEAFIKFGNFFRRLHFNIYLTRILDVSPTVAVHLWENPNTLWLNIATNFRHIYALTMIELLANGQTVKYTF